MTIQQAADRARNFTVFCHPTTPPPPIRALLDDLYMRLDGFVGPGHVSMVTGSHPYDLIARDYGKPIVVAGFEPLDLLQSALMVLAQIEEGRADVAGHYAHVVPEHGNPVSTAACVDVYEPRDTSEWRGSGEIDRSGLKIRPRYAAFDAERRATTSPSEARSRFGCRRSSSSRRKPRSRCCAGSPPRCGAVLKHPFMFRAALAVVTKMDLAPHLGSDRDALLAKPRAVNPQARVLPLSARTGGGMAGWHDLLRTELAR